MNSAVMNSFQKKQLILEIFSYIATNYEWIQSYATNYTLEKNMELTRLYGLLLPEKSGQLSRNTSRKSLLLTVDT